MTFLTQRKKVENYGRWTNETIFKSQDFAIPIKRKNEDFPLPWLVAH